MLSSSLILGLICAAFLAACGLASLALLGIVVYLAVNGSRAVNALASRPWPVSNEAPPSAGHPGSEGFSPGEDYGPFRPTSELVSGWSSLFATKMALTHSERQVYDTLLSWLFDDLSARYGDRFVILAKVPLTCFIQVKDELPPVLRRALDVPTDFLICTRGDKVVPVVGISIWRASVGEIRASGDLLPEQHLRFRDLTRDEWEQWIAMGIMQAAGISTYLVTEQMALSWGRICRDFLVQLEEDLGKAL